MVDFDATESMTPFREGSGLGAILFDSKQLRQADPEWFLPAKWSERARPVDSGGRGGAWFIDAPFGPSLLRLYLRGGLPARTRSSGVSTPWSTALRNILSRTSGRERVVSSVT
jgi:3-deoxy-D-manno-octulosonic acid kinase